MNGFQINPSNYRSVTCAPNPSPPPTKINCPPRLPRSLFHQLFNDQNKLTSIGLRSYASEESVIDLILARHRAFLIYIFCIRRKRDRVARVNPNGMIPSNERDNADGSICAGIDGDETNLSLMIISSKKFYLPCPLPRFAHCLCSLLFLPPFSSPPSISFHSTYSPFPTPTHLFFSLQIQFKSGDFRILFPSLPVVYKYFLAYRNFYFSY